MTDAQDMTPAETIEYLATEIMGWVKYPYTWNIIESDRSIWPCKECGSKEHTGHNYKWITVCDKCESQEDIERSGWNPLSSWDNWRQVELKVMNEKSALWGTYLKILEGKNAFDFPMRADLPTRCQALISAHRSLSAS